MDAKVVKAIGSRRNSVRMTGRLRVSLSGQSVLTKVS
jgi:hypothetical protein